MADPILAMHRHSAGCYELSSLRTGSLRDQMLRATAMVERLHDTDHIGSGSGRGLLVIGGGAAGLCAAKRASELGIEVHLAEASARLLGPQRGVTTRLIDPVEYDWPHGHWDQASFPAGLGRSLPFDFLADSATKLAMVWDLAFQRSVVASGPGLGSGGPGPIHVHYNTTVHATDVHDLGAGKPHKVSNVRWQRVAGVSYLLGTALSCVGFGDENVDAGHFKGTPFWSSDDMDLWPANTRILVSGGGDGAMQDLQRAATGRFGRALFNALDLSRLLKLCPDLPDLSAVEDAHRRLLAWESPGKPRTQLLQSWHAPFERVADAIAAHWDQDAPCLQQALSLVQRPHVMWSMKSPTPGPSYALNRLLALLVVRLLERHPNGQGSAHLLTGYALRDVHFAPGQSGQAHFVNQPSVPVDRVVVRHGMKTTPGIPLFGDAAISVQQVPFALL